MVHKNKVGYSGTGRGMYWRQRQRTPKEKVTSSACKSDPNFFRTHETYRNRNVVAEINTTYLCVYVSLEIVIFVFYYQGRERSLTVYKNDLKDGDWWCVYPSV